MSIQSEIFRETTKDPRYRGRDSYRYAKIFEATDRKYVPAQFQIHQHRTEGNPQIKNGRHFDIALFKRTAPQLDHGAADTDNATRAQTFF